MKAENWSNLYKQIGGEEDGDKSGEKRWADYGQFSLLLDFQKKVLQLMN